MQKIVKNQSSRIILDLPTPILSQILILDLKGSLAFYVSVIVHATFCLLRAEKGLKGLRILLKSGHRPKSYPGGGVENLTFFHDFDEYTHNVTVFKVKEHS